MKKAIAVVLTLSMILLGSGFVSVNASHPDDDNPDILFPLSIKQG